jgi:hypothetical protein
LTAVAQIVDHPALGLLAGDVEGPIKRSVCRAHPKVRREHEQRLAHGLHDALGELPGALDLLLPELALGDVGEGDHDAIDPVVAGPIRQEAADIGPVVIPHDLARPGHEPLQDFPRLLDEISAREPLSEVGHRSADVRGTKVEQPLHGRREPADTELTIQE